MSDSLDEASRVLLEAAARGGEFVRFVRDPLTGERGLVVAVRGEAIDDVLAAMQARRPSLVERLTRSLARD